MALSPGTRLGHYEIAGLLGEGGMGEVYRALDTRLDRQVAIKILPESVAQDPDRLARFEREAKVLAALNHANIAAIYGVEERALVMELVEGPTLAERIALGPVPLAEVLPIARQIAEALEAAHEKGIIHRDLKPANVKVRSDGTVKVLDFGLAKAMDSGLAPGSSIHSPTMLATMTAVSTKVGMIMGTASYMSPEQARGAAVDRRADVWSFGVMLLEMLTGRMLFGGESVSDTLAAVLRDRIDLDRLSADTPPSLRRLLRRALERDVKRRMTDMGAARLEIDEALAGEAAEPSAAIATPERKPSRLPWVAAAIASLAALGLAAGWWRASRPVEQTPLRFNVELATSQSSSPRNSVAISTDGTRLAFVRVVPLSPPLVAMRLLEQQRDVLLQGTDGAAYLFFSPDGQWIGFGTNDGKLKKISIQGGAVTTICDAPNMRGASWTGEGEIIFSPDGRSLMRVPAAGGTPQPVTKAGTNTYWERWPQILPGGQWVLFTEGTEGGGSVVVVSLKSGERKTVAPGARFGRYLPNGYLLYHTENTLMGVRFDPIAAQAHGTPVPILDDVAIGILGGAQFAFSETGTLVYVPGTSGAVGWPVSWLDGSGKIEPFLAKPDRYYTPQLSPDGKLLALAISSGSAQDISVYDPARDTITRISFTGKSNRYPIWAPDARHLIFTSWEPYALWWVRSDGAGQPQKLTDIKGLAGAGAFTPDGKAILYAEIGPESGYDIWKLPLDLGDPEHPKAGNREAILNSPNGEVWPGVSPDGRWLVYGSNESGTYQVYVRPFSGGVLGAGKWQISSGAGGYPLWSRNGRELFYEVDGRIMVVDYTAKGDSFFAQKPRLWSDRQILAPEVHRHADLAPDGKRFVIFPQPDGPGSPGLRVTVILNFFDEVRRKIGVK